MTLLEEKWIYTLAASSTKQPGRKNYIAGTQDGVKVATDTGVHVLERFVMLVLNGENYVAYLRQPIEPQFHGKLHIERVETPHGELCGTSILIRASALLAKEGIL